MGSKIIKSKINLFFFLQVNRVSIPEIVIGGYFLVVHSSGNRGGLVHTDLGGLVLHLSLNPVCSILVSVNDTYATEKIV